jgi:tetratricopeptide (TPR) repeat protein
MKIHLTIFFLFALSISCKSQQKDLVKANEYNTLGSDVMVNNMSNTDSLNKALDYFEKAIVENDTFFTAYSNKLALLLQLGRCDKAFSFIDKILTLGKHIEELKMLKGNILEGQNNLDKANAYYKEVLETYDKQIAAEPKRNDLKLNRAFALFFTANTEVVLKEYHQLKDENPHDRSVLFMEEIFEEFNRNEYIQSICHRESK